MNHFELFQENNLLGRHAVLLLLTCIAQILMRSKEKRE